jgi:hypothetical protein
MKVRLQHRKRYFNSVVRNYHASPSSEVNIGHRNFDLVVNETAYYNRMLLKLDSGLLFKSPNSIRWAKIIYWRCYFNKNLSLNSHLDSSTLRLQARVLLLLSLPMGLVLMVRDRVPCEKDH